MKSVPVLLFLLIHAAAEGREAKLVRYPHWHNGRVAFSYLGDVWTADAKGGAVQRVTAHTARDVYPRFSPDGKWIAFSSERNGNLDVYVIPAGGGEAKQLTWHSADDNVLAWSPDSKQILFSSGRGDDFAPRLYTISAEGGMERDAGVGIGQYGTWSPDGRKLAINRKSGPYWRKRYRGALQSDVTVVDLAAKKFTDLTDFDGIDSWPMWARDGHIYFVSERDASVSNIWRVSEKGGKAERISAFEDGDVRWAAISADGKVITFEHEFGIWSLDVDSRKAAPIRIDIAAETQDSMNENRTFSSQADDYDLAPNSRRVVFSIHGEVFTAPVEEGDLRQVTESPSRDRNVSYSPDGKQIAFLSDRNGREELYVVPSDQSAEPRKITELDSLKGEYVWSPDSKEIAVTTSDARLFKVNVATGAATELASSKFGWISDPAWSPDGGWIAFSRPDYTRNSDIWLVTAAGGEEHRASFDVYNDGQPAFSADGKKLYFARMEGNPNRSNSNFTMPPMSIYVVALEKQEKDPDDPEAKAESEEPAAGDAAARRTEPPKAPSPVTIDFAGLKRRTRAVTQLPGTVGALTPARDGRTLAFVTTEGTGPRAAAVVYTIQDDGRKLTRVTGSTPPVSGVAPGSPGEGRDSIEHLRFSRDGKTLYFRRAQGIFSVAIPAASPGGSGVSPGPGAAPKRISFTARVRIDKSAEWAEMFGDAWRTMKYRFYDPRMHGRDWDAMRTRYQPLVEHVGDRRELLNLINEMIGELNASHTGTAPPPSGGRDSAAASRHLGFDLVEDGQAGRYKVGRIYEDGPADKDWVRVKTGDYLIAIDARPVIAGDNYWRLLNNPLNRRVTLTLNSRRSLRVRGQRGSLLCR